MSLRKVLAFSVIFFANILHASSTEREPQKKESEALDLVKSSRVVSYICEGEETGINSMTGEERTIPVSHTIKISGKSATLLSDLDDTGIPFSVDERDDRFVLYHKMDGVSGLIMELNFEIEKANGSYTSKSWLFTPENVVTSHGKCEESVD